MFLFVDDLMMMLPYPFNLSDAQECSSKLTQTLAQRAALSVEEEKKNEMKLF